MRPGQRVRLNTPDNPRLDGAVARVARLTSYGALVMTAAAGSGQFRALAEEMVPDDDSNGYTNRLTLATGDVCTRCGGGNMIRTGACLTCGDCGESGGCG